MKNEKQKSEEKKIVRQPSWGDWTGCAKY